MGLPKNLSIISVEARFVTLSITTIAIATTAALSLSASAEAATLGTGLSISQDFTGSQFSYPGFIPPDTQGAVGPNQIAEFVNGQYNVYDKTNAQPLDSSTLNQFWTKAGINNYSNFTFDPRVLYDSSSNRWFAASVDNAGQPNNFLLAVSKTQDPTAGWTGFEIKSDSTNQHWADYPTLGLNQNGVYLAANMFPLLNSYASLATTIVAVPKSSLIAGTIDNYTKFENQNFNTTGFTLQPVVNQDNNGLPEALLSDYNTSAGFFKRLNITGSITAPATVGLNSSNVKAAFSATPNTPTQIGEPIAVTDPDLPSIPISNSPSPNSPTLGTSNTLIPVKPYSPPPAAQQPDGSTNLDAGDSRLSSSLILKNGIIWGVQGVKNPDGNHAALRFFKIRASDNTVLQDQLIGDMNSDYYYGSIAVNPSNNVVLSFNKSSSTEKVSSYAELGVPDSSSNTIFSAPVILQSGLANYQLLDSNGRNRWGDYSATVLDPNDPSTFWTFQEYANASGSWSTNITQLQISQATAVPEPSFIMSLLTFGAIAAGSLLKRSSAIEKFSSEKHKSPRV